MSALEFLHGGEPSAVHRCGNCVLWSSAPGQTLGTCEIGDHPLHEFRGERHRSDQDGGLRTTSESYCDSQVPIPPPGPPCPKCGAPTADGFGLAGGYGPYTYCENDACDYFDKVFLPDDVA